MAIRREPVLAIRLGQLVIATTIITLFGWYCVFSQTLTAPSNIHPAPLWQKNPGIHPIEHLTDEAQQQWQRLWDSRSHSMKDAAQQYRSRRGRHPPPGFDRWYQYAQARDAFVVEDLFDRIHDDLNPFWGVNASVIRRQAKHSDYIISIRYGEIFYKTDHEREWMDLWLDMIGSVAAYLPDVDIPINVLDEPRIVVSWEKINELLKNVEVPRVTRNAKDIRQNYSGLSAFDQEKPQPMRPEWNTTGPYWDLVRPACHPESPGRNAPWVTNHAGPPPLRPQIPVHSFGGYVANWTQSKDVCERPELRELHGSFIEPTTIRTSTDLFPMFGGSKLAINNDILLPPAMYWSKNELDSGGTSNGADWGTKLDMVMWRGAASGGRNRESNWARFQRHRFVAMMNGTAVRYLETTGVHEPHFILPPYYMYNLSVPRVGRLLGDWLAELVDAAFVDLVCYPRERDARRCSYTNSRYRVRKMVPMKKQFEYRYLPDIDGNSYSGRFRSFLLSTSLPIKATMYNEWHDSRLIPWVHFVPMDNTFIDIYGILDYYRGSWATAGHDAAARKIAEDGKLWAEKVLRREDMQIYVYRLLLEYARICDDERDRLGYAGDL